MNWDKMTPEERDRLVAEKVMSWQAKECDGEMGELPCSPDGWFCQKCGYSGSWGDDYTHEELPRHYTQSMDRAWEVILTFKDADHLTLWTREDASGHTSCSLALRGSHGENYFSRDIDCAAKTLPEAICLVALQACGVSI